MTEYIVRRTDVNMPSFTVSEDTVDRTSVDVPLIGRIFTNYGTDVNENLLNILENFACPEDSGSTTIYDAVPDLNETSKEQLHQPIEGQFWYNSTRELIYYFNGTDWIPLPVRGNYAANWGQIVHGQALPRPQNQSGYLFPYDECIWSVAPASINGSVDMMTCTTDDNAVVNFQYRYTNTTTIVNGIANYLIVGISGNQNNGNWIPPVSPTPTPTVNSTSTPAATASPTPSPTPTLTPTTTPAVTPTQTAAVSPTPAPSTTPQPSATSTPAPTPTPTSSVTPTPAVIVQPGLPLSLGGGCYIRNGSIGTSVSYFLEFGSNGNITEGSSIPPVATPGNRGTWLGNVPGDVASNYEIRFVGSPISGGLSAGVWYNLGTTRNFSWVYTLSGISGGRIVQGTFELRRVATGVIVDTCPLEPTQLSVNQECL